MSTELGPSDRQAEVAIRAHEKWQMRIAASQVDDWLDAEAEIYDRQTANVERHRVADIIRQHDLESRLAREIQQQLLPKPHSNPLGLLVSGRSVPASRAVGGDYFDYFATGDTSVGLAIGDASGHGIGSALVITETRAYIRALALTSSDPAEILKLTNRRLAQDLSIGHFVTLLLARIDLPTRQLQFAGAGHCAGYVLGPGGVIKATLPSEGLPLGIDSTLVFPSGSTVQLQVGDLIFLYTDGLPDAGVVAGPPFGIARALDCLKTHENESLEALLQALFKAVGDYAGTAEQFDDITVLLVRI